MSGGRNARYTVVYVDDDGQPHCFGVFRSLSAASALADRINRDLDDDRDEAGGGAGLVAVCMINRRGAWR